MKLMIYEEWVNFPGKQEKDEKSVQQRLEVVEYMRKFGFLLKVNTLTVSKAQAIFHRYTLQYCYKQFNRLLYGSAAIFLANKLDDYDFKKNFLEGCAKTYIYLETHQISIKSLVQNPFEIKENEEKFRNFIPDQMILEKVKEQICECELDLLHNIGYDFDIELPYTYIDLYMNSNLVQNDLFWKIANIFVNDSFSTLVCLYYEPMVIALAAISVAQVYSKIEFPVLMSGKPWFKFFCDDLNIDQVNECADHMRQIYKLIHQ